VTVEQEAEATRRELGALGIIKGQRRIDATRSQLAPKNGDPAKAREFIGRTLSDYNSGVAAAGCDCGAKGCKPIKERAATA
jgi:hypothetical protein